MNFSNNSIGSQKAIEGLQKLVGNLKKLEKIEVTLQQEHVESYLHFLLFGEIIEIIFMIFCILYLFKNTVFMIS